MKEHRQKETMLFFYFSFCIVHKIHNILFIEFNSCNVTHLIAMLFTADFTNVFK